MIIIYLKSNLSQIVDGNKIMLNAQLFLKPCNFFKTNGLMDNFCPCLFSHLKYWKDLMAVSPINWLPPLKQSSLVLTMTISMHIAQQILFFNFYI